MAPSAAENVDNHPDICTCLLQHHAQTFKV